MMGRSRTQRIDSPQLGAILADQTYTAAGLRARSTFGNGVLTARAYDPRLRPSTITTHPPHNGPPFLDYRYRYDGAANVLAITDQRPASLRAQRFDNSQRFAYDDLYRLTGAVYDTGRLALAYDRIGNLTERRFVAVPGALAGPSTPGRIRHGGSAGASDRIGRPTNAPGPQAPSSDETGRAYTYDANGNLTQLGDMTLTWDFKDRLVAVERPTVQAEYVYDYTGRRIVKRVLQGPATAAWPAARNALRLQVLRGRGRAGAALRVRRRDAVGAGVARRGAAVLSPGLDRLYRCAERRNRRADSVQRLLSIRRRSRSLCLDSTRRSGGTRLSFRPEGARP